MGAVKGAYQIFVGGPRGGNLVLIILVILI
jgi:hypothetical protein